MERKRSRSWPTSRGRFPMAYACPVKRNISQSLWKRTKTKSRRLKIMLELMFDWLWRRFFEVVMLSVAVALITFALWVFLEAIEPYQAAQQALYLR